MREQRKAARLPITLHAKCKVKVKARSEVLEFKTHNLSECGALLNRQFRPGREIKIDLSLNSYSAPINLQAIVVRKDPAGCGVKFCKGEGTKKSRKDIEQYVKVSLGQEAKIRKREFYDKLQSLKQPSRIVLENLLGRILSILSYKEIETQKDKLSNKDIFNAIRIAEARYSNGFRFEAKGDLAQFFGRTFGPDDAIKFYEKNIEGDVSDKYGRKINIREDVLDFLFKDPKTGRHDPLLANENYQESRGKRLPWVKHIIENTQEVYEFQDQRQNLIVTYYAGTGMVPTRNGAVPNYFLVVVHKRGSHPMELKTAFFMEEDVDLLKKICLCKVYFPYVNN